MTVKKLRYLAYALVAVAFCACQKEPSTSGLHKDYLVYTAYDTEADFGALDTYYLPDSILLIVLNTVLQRFGGPGEGDILITCATIVQSFMLIITMPLGGITAGTQSILGYNYGACDEKRVMKAFRCIVLLCLVFCGIMFLLAQTVSGAFVKIFTKDPAYIDMAAYMIRTYSLGVLGLTIQYPFVDGMTGMGLVKWGLTFSMLRKGIFLVSVFVLPPIFGATAVMFSEPLSDVVSAVFSGCAAMFLLPKLVAKQCCK